jgi:uncharacterized membrane protein YjgN (DUF898 family)
MITPINWYYAVGGRQFGPISVGEFNQKVGEGIIQPDTLVWHDGMAKWQPWREVAAGAAIVNRTQPAEVLGESQAGGIAGGFARDAQPLRFQFTGAWESYFRVWIVNVLLTIVTLGIYAAWAKVRKMRWFYAHTFLAGHSFEYLADPKRILVGNIIVGLLFIAYAGSGAVSPLVQLPVILVVMVAVPWFIAKSFLFNARNSAWRGLRFGFHGRYWGAARVYLLLPMLVPLTLGLMLPYVTKERRKWMTENHRFGTTPFGFAGTSVDLTRIYLRGVLFFLPLIGAYIFMFVAIAVSAGRGRAASAEEIGPMMAIFPILFLVSIPVAYVGTIFLRARLFSYHWTQTSIGPHTFQAYMRARDLLGLQLLNSLVVSLTFGLMWPWAAVRTAKFQLDHIEMMPGGDLDTFVAEAQPPVGAIGDVASDFMDFDLGFGA